MQVQLRKLSSIKPYKRNPRLNEKAVVAVASQSLVAVLCGGRRRNWSVTPKDLAVRPLEPLGP